MGSSGVIGAFSERWPHAGEVLQLANDLGPQHREIKTALASLESTAQRHLVEAILMLWDVHSRPSSARTAQIAGLVGSAVEAAPVDSYVRLYAAMIMLDMRDLRQAIQHLKALSQVSDDVAGEFSTPKAEAALAHVTGRVVAASGKDDDLAKELLAAAVDLDPSATEYRRALELHCDRSAQHQIIGTRERPSIDQFIARLPL